MRNEFSYKITEEEKKSWKRIPERETNRFTGPLLPVGYQFYASQTIARVGYYFQNEDVPTDWVEEHRIDQIKSNLAHFNTKNQDQRERIQSVISDMESIRGLLGIYNDQFWRHVDYQLRGQWVANQRKTLPDDQGRMRVAWYAPHEFQTDYVKAKYWATARKFEIIGYRNFWQGKYYPPSGGGHSYWDEDPYEPGGLYPRTFLRVYVCKSLFNQTTHLIHPQDTRDFELED